LRADACAVSWWFVEVNGGMVEILGGAWVLETQLLIASSTSSKPKNDIHLQIPILIVSSIKYGNSQA